MIAGIRAGCLQRGFWRLLAPSLRGLESRTTAPVEFVRYHSSYCDSTAIMLQRLPLRPTPILHMRNSQDSHSHGVEARLLNHEIYGSTSVIPVMQNMISICGIYRCAATPFAGMLRGRLLVRSCHCTWECKAGVKRAASCGYLQINNLGCQAAGQHATINRPQIGHVALAHAALSWSGAVPLPTMSSNRKDSAQKHPTAQYPRASKPGRITCGGQVSRLIWLHTRQLHHGRPLVLEPKPSSNEGSHMVSEKPWSSIATRIELLADLQVCMSGEPAHEFDKLKRTTSYDLGLRTPLKLSANETPHELI